MQCNNVSEYCNIKLLTDTGHRENKNLKITLNSFHPVSSPVKTGTHDLCFRNILKNLKVIPRIAASVAASYEQ